MKTALTTLSTALLLLSGATAQAQAPIAPVPTNNASSVEHVRWVCGPYGRCWWRPNYYGGYYGYAYAPRPWYWRHRHWRHHYW